MADKEIIDGNDQELEDSLPVSGMYRNWFLEYASYVILDRAVPYIQDGLKPVQRRILHAMYELEDGRFNKVANIIGATMQFHPHGDAAIGDAITNMGQKDLLIDTQGNWGNIYTGDSSAAPRYIEARLSKFALEVVFNPQTTNWQLSYDGRKREPVTLPVKFPLVLAHGVEGIAVGLSTKILPHNFIELCEASIAYLQKKSFQLFPDFPTGGLVDVTNYNKGERGGKIRVRAKISIVDKKTLVISELPFGTTTTSLIDSILKANDKGKIKIRKVDDNTARNVDILVHLAPNISPDVTIDALYAFTECEVSISPNTCIIINDHPHFTNVDDVLKLSTQNTVQLLKTELEIRRHELEESWHFSSLEKIFIEKRIYRDIEEEETWEGVLSAIDKGLKPYKKKFRREITRDDILRLTEIKIKRISKFDSFKADEEIRDIEKKLEEINYNLEHLTSYAVKYFRGLIDKFGKGKERKTEIKTFDTIQASKVAIANERLYMNAADGFIGTSLRRDTFVTECSDIDDIIVFRADGVMMVTKVAEKTFVGKNILWAGVFKKNDDRMVYHMIYTDSGDKRAYVKRFQVLGVTRDKEYNLTKTGKPGKVHYFTANPNGESEVVNVRLKPKPHLRKTEFNFDFGDLEIKGRSAGGNIITRYDVSKVVQKSVGVSTLGGRDIWFDPTVNRLNADGIGTYLGNFQGDDNICVIFDDGSYELTGFELSNNYESKGKLADICKLEEDTIVNVIYYDGKQQRIFVKRFQIETLTANQKFPFISEEPGSKLIFATTKPGAVAEIVPAGRKKDPIQVDFEEFMDVKGWKAIGNKLTDEKIISSRLVSFDQTSMPRPSVVEETRDPLGPEKGKTPQPNLFSPGEELKKKSQTSTSSKTRKRMTQIALDFSTPKKETKKKTSTTSKKAATTKKSTASREKPAPKPKPAARAKSPVKKATTKKATPKPKAKAKPVKKAAPKKAAPKKPAPKAKVKAKPAAKKKK